MAQGMDNTMQFSFSLTCTIFYLSRMKNPTCDAALCTKYTVHGSYPFLNKKFKDFSRTFKDFQGHISHFSRTPFSAKKSLESMSVLLRSHHEQFYREDLSVFAPFPWQFSLDYKVSTKIQGLSSTNYNFQDFFHNFYSKIHGLSRTFKVCANPD